MSTTVTYKGNTLATVSNNTKTLKTAGKYMEDDVQLTDTTTGSGNVWQDAQGYVHLDDEGTPPISVEALSITQNGTYTATTGHAYSPVTVNVSGGASAWTKVAETSYQVSTTDTSLVTVDSWVTGHSELWTSDKIVYVRIRDTAGKRNGYFYGTDTFFLNMYPVNNSSSRSNSSGNIISICWAYASQGAYVCRYGHANAGYGVYPDMFSYNGEIRIRSRYDSSYSLTINGTYKVEVYLLDPPTGTSIFT